MARKKRTLEEIKEYQANWRKANRQKMRDYAKVYRNKHRHSHVQIHLAKKYNLTIEGKQQIWDSQVGLCAVCSQALPDIFQRDCQVEHDHITGRVRGLAHWYCNIVVGVMENHPVLLEKVVRYLETHKRDAIVRTQENMNLERSAEMPDPCLSF